MSSRAEVKSRKSKDDSIGLSQGQIVRKRFFGNTAALVSMVIFVLVVILAFSSIGYAGIPGWWKWSYTDTPSLATPTGSPTWVLPFDFGDHPFGQDRVGRDLFAMTMRGTQLSLLIMFIIGILGGILGVIIGGVSGYFRGWVEAVLMRFTDVIIVIPLIILAAVLGSVGNNLTGSGTFLRNVLGGSAGVILLGIFVGLIIWTGLARLVRGEFLSLREREFVDAARIAGASDTRIIFKHILPNAVGVIIVNTTLVMASAILLESALSFLGLGVRAPDISLGSLISDNQQAFNTRPWLFWWPGLFIILICLSINFIGDGLRDAFDPRQKKFNAKKAVHSGDISDPNRPEA
ncbi:ABC transporter permease [Arthrobacter sp. CAN_A1]|uniref:ABC transporter permease n=1 Tax=Arthrobacter sp. CAN_A1 TaxID=2787717 RepID=UPI0018C9141C